MLIDTHCHLDAAEFDPDRAQVLARARAAGVGLIVVPAVEVANFGTVARLAAETDRCAYALGIHPMYVDRAAEEGVTRDEVFETMSIGLIVGGSIVIPHLRRAVDRWDDCERMRQEQA